MSRRQALKDRVVLRIYRKELGTRAGRLAQENLAGHNQWLLVRNEDLLAGSNGGERRKQTGRPDNRGHDDIGIFIPCY